MPLSISSAFKKIFFAFTFLFLTFAFTSVVSAAPNAATDYLPLVNVPGITPEATLTQYLSGLYNFLISVVGIFAMAVIVYGGMRYLTSAGNPAAVEEAKDAIMSAIYGLILALGSWLIINIVNPDILVLKNPGVGLSAGSYGAGSSTAKCTSGPGDGTATSPCLCLDGAKAVAAASAGSIPTGVTLTASPNPVPVSPMSTVKMSGKLTDDKGIGISGVTVKVNMINSTLNASTTFSDNTDASGDYAVFFTADTCGTNSDDVKMQAVFDGDATYVSSSSGSVSFVINGIPSCASINYLNSPAVSLVGSAGGSFCNQVCSDKTKQASVSPDPPGVGYHCVGAKILATGTNVVMNPDGISANMKVNGDVTLDGVTNSVFSSDAARINSTFAWTIGGYTGNTPTVFLNSSTGSYPFTTAGPVDVKLVITPKSPSAPGVPEPIEAHFTMYVAPL